MLDQTTSAWIAFVKTSWYVSAVALFQYLNVPTEQFSILASLMLIDFLTGVWKQFRIDRKEIKSHLAWLWLMKKTASLFYQSLSFSSEYESMITNMWHLFSQYLSWRSDTAHFKMSMQSEHERFFQSSMFCLLLSKQSESSSKNESIKQWKTLFPLMILRNNFSTLCLALQTLSFATMIASSEQISSSHENFFREVLRWIWHDMSSEWRFARMMIFSTQQSLIKLQQ